MSRAERVLTDDQSVLTLDSGLDALRSSPSFRGPVESLDGHESNEHMALIYESQDEQVAATVPYLVQGLQRGERCMCLLEDDSKEAVLDGLRESEVDVDAALDAGALTFHTLEETYLRGGKFDPDEMLSFYADVIEEATREYEALRIAASISWLLDESASTAEFMAYESKVNELFHGEDCIALCQYDRNRFPPEVLSTVIQTHPHLVYDNTVCHNFYYTPPEEFFGPDQPDREIDRMMRTLIERTEAKVALQEREHYLRRQNEVTADPDRSFEEKLQALLEMGCERFDLELGAMARVDPERDRFVLEYVSEDHEHFAPGVELPLSETYCTAAVDGAGPASVTDPAGDGYGDIRVCEEFGIQSYFGTHVPVEGDLDRTLFFVSSESRDEPFSNAEHTFHRLTGQWLKYELEQQQRERTLSELYETAAATDLSFEGKVQQLLELGRERFELDVGFFSRIDGDSFEIVQAVGDHEKIQPGSTAAFSETYCREVIREGGSLDLEHASEEGWADEDAYERYGLESFIGTTVDLGNDTYGTLCFADTSPHSRGFSDHERAFLELTSQWVGYELEREHREAQLAALNEMARDLMSKESRDDIAAAAVDHAETTLKLPISTVLTYDRDTGGLRPVAQTERAADGLPTTALCDPDGGALWETFVANEVRTVDDVGRLSGADDDLTEAIAVPLGTHGLFVAATTDGDGFCPAERDFVETTAATVETVTVRAERERQLQERERTLEAQNETLERLDRVNDIIRSIDQALVQASTREEIEDVVCEQLATVGPYELAWVGEFDQVGGSIRPSQWAGADKGYLDGLEIETGSGTEGDHLAARAIESRAPKVTNDILSDAACDEWRQDALNRGYHAAVSLPLVYKDTCYGVLTLYAGQPGVFDELERSVLAELSETIAYAINAVESKKALVSEAATVLEFEVADDALGLVALARETGCEVTTETVVSRSDGRLRTYFTTSGASAREVLDLEPALPLTDVNLIGERDAEGEAINHFEATLEDESLASTVLEHGGRLREAAAADGSATVVVELAADAAVREFVDMFSARYPDSELLAQYSDERDYRTAAEFHATVTEELTPRQLEAIQTAYYSGFFERPRPRTGDEIAGTMDISQPTFNAHLRTAQRKLCQRLFDAESV